MDAIYEPILDLKILDVNNKRIRRSTTEVLSGVYFWKVGKVSSSDAYCLGGWMVRSIGGLFEGRAAVDGDKEALKWVAHCA